jgi:putative ABC transport system substrate-binding protein
MVSLLVSRGNPIYKRDTPWATDVAVSARGLGVELDVVDFENDAVEDAIASAAARGAQGLIGAADGVVVARRKEIADSAIKHRLPTIFAFRENVETGGLMMYAARTADLSRRAAFFVDRILKGASPANLPVEQPTLFELIINLHTAKLLGLTLPPTLLAQADEVIE